MLNKNVFKEEMQKLVIFYPSWNIQLDDSVSMKAWYNMMVINKATDESLTNAVIEHIKTQKFNPTIATLLECGLKEKPKDKGFVDLSEVTITYADGTTL